MRRQSKPGNLKPGAWSPKPGAWCLVLLLGLPQVVAAHPAPFSYLDLRLDDAGVEGSLVLHDFDVAHDLGIDPPEALRDIAVATRYRDQLTRLIDSRLTIALDGRRHALTWTGLETLPDRQSVRLTFRANGRRAGTARVTAVLFPYDPAHQTFVNISEDGSLRHQAILDLGRTTLDYYAGSWQGTTAVVAVFVPAGIEHILIGPDHVLFLIGLHAAWRIPLAAGHDCHGFHDRP